MTTGKVSFQTVEYLLHLILELDEANTQLRLEAESIAADERAKIVALLNVHLDDWCKEETESGDIKHQYHQGSDALERLLLAIEAEEHLK